MTGQIKKCRTCGKEFEDRSWDDLCTQCFDCSEMEVNEILRAGKEYTDKLGEAYRLIEDE